MTMFSKKVKTSRKFRLRTKFRFSLVPKTLQWQVRTTTLPYTFFDLDFAQKLPKSEESTNIALVGVKKTVFQF